MFLGVKMVLAKSFQRIHADNLVNFGILPCTFKDGNDYDALQAGDELTAVGIARAIAGNAPLVVRSHPLPGYRGRVSPDTAPDRNPARGRRY